MPEEKNFRKFCEEKLSLTLFSFETDRRKIARQGMLAGVCGLAAIILFFVTNRSGSSFAGVLFALAVLAVIVFSIGYFTRKKRYTAEYKAKIIRPVIEYIDPSLKYDPRQYINENDYKKSGLFLNDIDSYEGDDYVEGKRDKTFFCFSELHVKEEVSSGKSSELETTFKGLFFIADFNKNFHGRTYVWSEENPQLGFFSKIFSSFGAGLEKVKLESTEFEGRFVVYSSDQVEVRYILTPSFMENMMELQNQTGFQTSFSFVDTNIFVAVPVDGNLFEPPIFSANDYSKLEEYYNTVHIAFNIIDELQLNRRIWNKE